MSNEPKTEPESHTMTVRLSPDDRRILRLTAAALDEDPQKLMVALVREKADALGVMAWFAARSTETIPADNVGQNEDTNASSSLSVVGG